MTRSGPSFKSVDVCARSRPLPLACRSSLLTESTLSTTVLPNIDGHHSVTFTSTRGGTRLADGSLSAGDAMSGGTHEKRDLYALDLSTVRVRSTGAQL